MRFRRTEAIDRLGISKTKFDRLVREGKIAVERDSTELLAGKPAVYVTLAELGRYLSITDDAALRVRLSLPKEKPAEQEPQPEPQQTAQPVEQEPEPQPTKPDAEAALRDTVFGGRHTLLGPIEPQPKVKPSGTSHMTSPIADDFDAPRPLESDDFLEMWQPGHKQRTEQMYRNCGLRKPSEQEKKQVVDAAVVAAAFRQGFTR